MPIQGILWFDQVSVSTTAVPLDIVQAQSGRVRPNAAHIQVETADIRYRLDGTAPTASVGTILEAGRELVLTSGDEVQQFSAISKDGGTATLNVHGAVEYIP